MVDVDSEESGDWILWECWVCWVLCVYESGESTERRLCILRSSPACHVSLLLYIGFI